MLEPGIKAAVEVERRRPLVVYCSGPGAKRHITLRVRQNSVVVSVGLAAPKELIKDLQEGIEWLENPDG